MVLKVDSGQIGGHNATGVVGIHVYHLDPGVRITYIAAEQERQVIPQVTYTEPEGKATAFNSTDARATPEELARDEHRVRDGVDCGKRGVVSQPTARRSRMIATRATYFWLWTSRIQRFSGSSE